MKKEPTKSRHGYLLLALTLIGTYVSAGELYRWSDEKGDVHYTDRIPAQYIENGYRVISEQGLTVHTILPRAEEQSQTQQDSRTHEEIIHDQRLLATYSNDSEIIATRDRKLADIETVITLTQETILLLESQFRQLTHEASDFEKQGHAIPDSLQQKIALTQKKIHKYQNSVSRRQQERQKLQQRFDKDLAHFREIKKALTQQ